MPQPSVRPGTILSRINGKSSGSVHSEPDKVYITHGKIVAAEVMRKHIRERLGWTAEVPEPCEEVDL